MTLWEKLLVIGIVVGLGRELNLYNCMNDIDSVNLLHEGLP